MKTYQDLEAVGQDVAGRAEFIQSAVRGHKSCEAYQTAAAAEAYYAKRNVTIEKFQRFLYTVQGAAVPDLFSANYKLKTGFFRRFVIQQTQYVLSNGVSFSKAATKKRLGAAFDSQIQRLAKKALVDGVAFGFWNLDRLEVFSFADTPIDPGFAPLYDADTGLLRAGVRYWASADTESERYTLYETDGYTDYCKRKGERIAVLRPKQAYIQALKQTEAAGVEDVEGRNYPGFPIIPLYANDLRESELVGIRESIDCYDFIKSGLANDIDDTSGFYWTLKNTGGMDDLDLQRFIERMKIVRAAVLDDDVEAEAHTLSIPTEARTAMLNLLKNDLYEDFQVVNVRDLSSGTKTATEIRAAYQPMDDKCGDFEYCIREFIGKLLALTGLEDEPGFQWNRIANQTEETQMVMTAASYLDDEAVLRHLPWLTPEEADEILKRKAADELFRFAPKGSGPDAEV